MKKLVTQLAVGLALVTAVMLLWLYLRIIKPANRYREVHWRTFETTDLRTLRDIAPSLVALSRHADPPMILRADVAPSSPLHLLDPAWVSIQSDQIMIELHGGFDHFGFVFRRLPGSINSWDVYRFTEKGEEMIGEYRP